MAKSVSLKDLIEALAGAVISAQDLITKHQTSNISQYFDDKTGRPIAANIKLPNMSWAPPPKEGEEDNRKDHEKDEDVYISIPLLALVGSSPLHIKGMDVEFEVDLSNFGETDETSTEQSKPSGDEETQGWNGLSKPKSIGVDWQSGDDKKMARLSLRVEAQEPTEGMARLIQRLNQLI